MISSVYVFSPAVANINFVAFVCLVRSLTMHDSSVYLSYICTINPLRVLAK